MNTVRTFLLALAFLTPYPALHAADPVALTPPTGFSVSQDGLREVVLTWTAPSSGSVRYRIERATQADGPFESIGEISSRKGTLTDQGAPGRPLEDAKAYYYRLVAVASGANSPPTETLRSVTAPAPAPPRDLKATAPSSRAVRLTWSVSTAGGVVKYRVERTESAKPDAFEALAEVAAAEYLDGGTAASTLKDSTPYLYRVISINRVNSMGPPSETTEVTTLPAPEAPRGLTAGSREVRCVPLQWEASPEEDVVRYDVYRGLAGTGPFEKIGTVSNRTEPRFLDGRTDPGTLEDEGTYFYRVRAINNVTAESADSEPVSATTREVPPQVEGVWVGQRQPREVPLSWQASPDEKVLGYEIWRAEGDGDFASVGRLGGPLSTNFVDRGGIKQFPEVGLLKDDTAYHYKIIAFNTAYARSSASAPEASQTKALPAQPAGLVATTNLPRAIHLEWPANTETDIVAYAVESSSDGSSFRPLAIVPQPPAGPVQAREEGLSDGTVRHYRLRAMDRTRLISPWSESVAGRAKPVPDAPTALKVEATPAGQRITWEPPAQPDIKAYKIYARTLFGSEVYAVTEKPELVVEWPLLKSPLKLVVAATDLDYLEGPKSEPVSVAPAAP